LKTRRYPGYDNTIQGTFNKVVLYGWARSGERSLAMAFPTL
jgi:hypothetical protein